MKGSRESAGGVRIGCTPAECELPTGGPGFESRLPLEDRMDGERTAKDAKIAKGERRVQSLESRVQNAELEKGREAE